LRYDSRRASIVLRESLFRCDQPGAIADMPTAKSKKPYKALSADDVYNYFEKIGYETDEEKELQEKISMAVGAALTLIAPEIRKKHKI